MDGFVLITALAVMILLGHIFGKLAEKFKLPDVTGMIVAGILISVFAKISNKEDIAHELVDKFQVVVVIALGFVSYMLGTKFFFPKVKKYIKTILPVLTLQLIFVILFTTLGFYIFSNNINMALLIGAISAATAPAPIIEITKKQQSRGALTNTLYSIVGLDNIIGISYFFIMLYVVKLNVLPEENMSVLEPILTIIISISLGVLFGIILAFVESHFLRKGKGHEKDVSYLLTFVSIVLLMSVGVEFLGNHILFLPLSPFISTFILGVVKTNFVSKEVYEYENKIIEEFVPPLIVAFFVIAGLELDVTKLFTKTGLFALLYVITHASGKYLGALIGTKYNKHTNVYVKKYLKTSVLTQGGFEIALAAVAESILPGSNILLIVLTSVLIFEFFAPLLLSKSLYKFDKDLRSLNFCELLCIFD